MDNFNDIKNVFNELVDIDSGIKISNEDIFRIIEEKRKQSFLSSIIKNKNYELIVYVIAMIGLLFYQEYRGFTIFTFTLMEIALLLCFIQSFIQSRILARLQFPDTVISFKKTVDKYKKTVHIFRVALFVLIALIIFSILFNEIVYSLKLVIIACFGLIICFCYILKWINQENKEMKELTEIVS